jgi:hypothetical protein
MLVLEKSYNASRVMQLLVAEAVVWLYTNECTINWMIDKITVY